jgi:hypothetical protein
MDRLGPSPGLQLAAAAEQNLAWLGRHTVHEGDHHLMDVANVLARASGIS